MRCRKHRRADLHSSQIDDLKDHLVRDLWPQSLFRVSQAGPPNYQISLPRYNPIRPNTVLQKALTDQNAIGWGRMCSGQISQDLQPRPPRQCCLPLRLGFRAHHATVRPIRFEDQWKLRNEALHGRDDAALSLFHRARLCDKATRFYAQAGTLLALDCPILSRPLATILDLPTTSLEAWIPQAEPTILRCISDACTN
jgi:hypothetical protein